jgi:predicted HicB family RNase H-like nuclease
MSAEALTGIRKLVKSCVKDMVVNKEAIPEAPSARNFSGKFIVRVPRRLIDCWQFKPLNLVLA